MTTFLTPFVVVFLYTMNEFLSSQSQNQIRLPIAVSLIIAVGVLFVSLLISKINAWAEDLTGASRYDVSEMSSESSIP